MLKNNLSNKAAPILGFSFERVVCEKFNHGVIGAKYTLNKQNINAINKMYWKDFSIFYITFEYPGRKLDKLEKELDDFGCMYNGTMRVNDVQSLLYWYRQQSSGWYYDTDKNLVDALYPFGQLWQEQLISIWNGE
jgi:hypothetical protein